MTDTAFDFSDILFTDPPRPRTLPGLSPTDTGIVHWFGKLVASRDAGALQLERIAWFVARLLTNGGVLVWLAQDGDLVDRGLCEIFAESAEFVPEPWCGFLRWAGQPANLDGFRAWPPYTTEDNLESRAEVHREPRKPPPRRRS